jgi:hypothetical protein
MLSNNDICHCVGHLPFVLAFFPDSRRLIRRKVARTGNVTEPSYSPRKMAYSSEPDITVLDNVLLVS